ncbi:hypothetical protein FHS16_005167 [Paenibacillus endophyticus]|uniref:Uncharacterized protein n=1 Tax=Paenibacillus endophyticus TaxID=1294268 RepID=A0A7W5CCB5_9BACL|nr:hypothetical protein [Paenibacillus endophyticus]
MIESGHIALYVAITLDRPRERDNDFVHFEKLILDRILVRDKHGLQRETAYSI